jgi:DNA-binding PadR family transcriptional regulator
MMDYAALGFLMYRPLSMYDLSKAMERSTRHFLSASFGSLHPTLRKLEQHGHVTSAEQVANGRRKKVFTLTASGREHFIAWLSRDIVAERVSDPGLLRLFFLGHLDHEAREDLLGRFLGQMRQASEELEALHASIKGVPVPPGAEEHMAYQLATLEFGIAHHRFVKDWYQAKLETLRQSRGES